MTKRELSLKHKGARLEWSSWMAKLRRERRAAYDDATLTLIDSLLKWGLGRKKRYEARPGGLGRKR
jgi:hypothetical protein